MADITESTTVAPAKSKVSSAPEKSSAPVGRGEATRGQVIVHVRFHPSGKVNTVNHRPDRVDPQDWFDLLCRRAPPSSYQALAGGRGVFHIQSDAFDAIWQDHEI
jgi:hypothetical protein